MKIQSLAVIAIIIILPMAIILGSYSDSQIKTLNLQISYDAKLNSATYDAIKAFQLNMSNSSTSDLANSKMRDIKASINTFYNSLSSNFNMSGYGENVLQNYVPAIVYTLYDGYYIYSAYDNKLDVYNEETNPQGDTFYTNATYVDGEKIYGLKPYIYYSCRYKMGSNSDFVITYSLDSYITVQGKVNGNIVNESGYLLSGVSKDASGNIIYNGIAIPKEDNKEGLRQLIYRPGVMPPSQEETQIIFYDNETGESCLSGSLKWYPYKKINGVKYYQDGSVAIASINDKILIQNDVNATAISNNRNGLDYYKKAYDFKKEFETGGKLEALKDLKTSNAVDNYGNPYSGENNPYPIDRSIFGELFNTASNHYIEDSNSVFNEHKTEVIKNAIESNLIVAISNYNKVSTSDVNFAMPRLQDYEWEEVTKNISMITFLQGLSIGGKVYNGYSIVRNDTTEDFVSENSIYISDGSTFYRVTDEELVKSDILNNDATIGLLNTDFERRTSIATAKNSNGKELIKNIYYYPRREDGAYSSIISLNNKNSIINFSEDKTISQYLNEGINNVTYGVKFKKLAQIYYTALGREREGMYRINNKYKEIQEKLRGDGY